MHMHMHMHIHCVVHQGGYLQADFPLGVPLVHCMSRCTIACIVVGQPPSNGKVMQTSHSHSVVMVTTAG